jgi:PAS domain-containing protein
MQRAARPKSLILILARDLASRLATPTFIVDAEGTLVFFNEAAEGVLGRTFAEAGEMKKEEWATEFSPVDDKGEPIPLEALPLGIALVERRAAYRPFKISAGDGVERSLEVAALPLYAHAGDLEGAVAVFWETTAT